MIDKPFIDKIKKQIVSEITNLMENEASRLQASQTVELDQASTGRLTRMDAMQQQAMAKENNRRAVLRNQQLHTALDRINNDEYGYCFDCDEEISTARLQANSVTTLCIECAEKKEKFK